MEATRRLAEEHREIEKGLPMLERITGMPVGIAMGADAVVEFFRNFAEACHHRKEEVVLFPALEAHGIPRKSGLVLGLLKEHGVSRRLLREIAGLLEPASEDFNNARSLLEDRIADYVENLRRHIAKEESQLWPLVERTLTSDEDKAIAAAYDKADDESIGQRNYRRYLEWTRLWAA